jgi:hypothetical protein
LWVMPLSLCLFSQRSRKHWLQLLPSKANQKIVSSRCFVSYFAAETSFAAHGL